MYFLYRTDEPFDRVGNSVLRYYYYWWRVGYLDEEEDAVEYPTFIPVNIEERLEYCPEMTRHARLGRRRGNISTMKMPFIFEVMNSGIDEDN